MHLNGLVETAFSNHPSSILEIPVFSCYVCWNLGGFYLTLPLVFFFFFFGPVEKLVIRMSGPATVPHIQKEVHEKC